MIELCGPQARAGHDRRRCPGCPVSSPFALGLRTARTEGLLGMEIGRERSAAYLRRLGFGTEPEGDDSLLVSVPPDRHFDITREVDLIEEVGRVHGIDEHLPATLPARPPGLGGLRPPSGPAAPRRGCARRRRPRRGNHLELRRPRRRGRTRARRRPGGPRPQPALGGSVGDAHRPAAAGCSTRPPTTSPVAPRGSACSSRAASTCRRRRRPRAGFSTAASPASARRPSRAAPDRRRGLRLAHRAGLARGRADGRLLRRQGSRRAPLRRRSAPASFGPAERPFLHPGRAAAVTIGERAAGWVGELHPTLAAERDLPVTVAFEIDAGALIDAAGRGAETYARSHLLSGSGRGHRGRPGRRRSGGRGRGGGARAGGELLRSARIFDVYEGEQVGEGRRSLALRLEFRAADRTLSDADVAGPREEIIAALAALGGELRG